MGSAFNSALGPLGLSGAVNIQYVKPKTMQRTGPGASVAPSYLTINNPKVQSYATSQASIGSSTPSFGPRPIASIGGVGPDFSGLGLSSITPENPSDDFSNLFDSASKLAEENARRQEEASAAEFDRQKELINLNYNKKSEGEKQTYSLEDASRDSDTARQLQLLQAQHEAQMEVIAAENQGKLDVINATYQGGGSGGSGGGYYDWTQDVAFYAPQYDESAYSTYGGYEESDYEDYLYYYA